MGEVDLNRIEQGGDTHTQEKVSDNEQTLTTHMADDAAHGIGNKATLLTSQKSTIVGAVNELFINVSDGKNLVGGAITDVDDKVNVPTDPTFQQLADSVKQIRTGVLETVAGDGAIVYLGGGSETRSTNFTKAKEVKALFSGSGRITFSLRDPRTGDLNQYLSEGAIYINGRLVGMVRTIKRGSTVEFTEDFNFEENDLIQLYTRNKSFIDYVYCDLFRISIGDEVITDVTS